jgi:hypothetical protein
VLHIFTICAFDTNFSIKRCLSTNIFVHLCLYEDVDFVFILWIDALLDYCDNLDCMLNIDATLNLLNKITGLELIS